MANFFKDYHAELAAKRSAEDAAKAAPRKVYSRGERVKTLAFYGSGSKYFADYLDNDYVLLADCKKDAMAGYGHIYQLCDIKE